MQIAGQLVDYQLKETAGQVLISVPAGNSKNGRPLVSERNPSREADRILAGYELSKGHVVIVMGAVHLELLRKLQVMKKVNGGQILLLEADPLLARALMQRFSEFKGVSVVTPQNWSRLEVFAESQSIEELTGYRILQVSGSVQLDRPFYQKAEDEVKRLLASRISDLFTRLEFEPVWLRNCLLNLPLVPGAIPVKALFGQGKGKTAAIVSTGPSLRHSLPWLKENQNKVFIACVDSAFRVLVTAGIEPHLVFTLDAQPHTLRHWEGLFSLSLKRSPLLVADMVSNPNVLWRWKGPLALSITAQYLDEIRVVTPGCDYLEDHFFGKELLGDVQSGGSVATSLFDLLRQMEFKKLLLFGQDLAYSYREIHCPGTHHSTQWISKNIHKTSTLEQINYSVLKKREVRMREGLNSALVGEDYVLSLYRHWFEQAQERAKLDVANCTSEGLPLEGFPEEKPPLLNSNLNWLLPTARLKNREALKVKIANFFSSMPAKWQSGMENEYPFMQTVGRKLKIRQLRVNQEHQEAEHLQIKIDELRNFFWKRLVSRRNLVLRTLEEQQ
jgi:hypothetical protein